MDDFYSPEKIDYNGTVPSKCPHFTDVDFSQKYKAYYMSLLPLKGHTKRNMLGK